MSVLLTGATGFLGTEVLVRLLEPGDTPVTVLVRAGSRAAAEARVEELLEDAGVDPARRPLVTALPAELTDVGLGLARGDAQRVVAETTSIVHCAASVAWDLPLGEARRINVDGTRRVLELAEAIERRGSLGRLVHVSTAYVAGRHRGPFAEWDLMVGQEFRNTYERSKAEAEVMVRRRAGRLPVSVVRPSIVVGESDSGWTPAFNVIYGPMRAFMRGLLSEVPALPSARIDIVPVDFVADAIVHVLGDRSAPPVLHATAGAEAVTAEQLVDVACSVLGRQPPRLVPPAAAASGAGADAAYVQYFDVEVVFDDGLSRSVLEPAGITPAPLEDYLAILVEHAKRARWGKRKVTRAEARSELARSRLLAR